MSLSGCTHLPKFRRSYGIHTNPKDPTNTAHLKWHMECIACAEIRARKAAAEMRIQRDDLMAALVDLLEVAEELTENTHPLDKPDIKHALIVNARKAIARATLSLEARAEAQAAAGDVAEAVEERGQ